MPRTPQELLLKAATKNPGLQALVDNVHDMSVEDIDGLTLPKFMREGLRKIKNTGMKITNFNQAFEEYMLKHTTITYSSDQLGVIYKWIGGDTYIKFGQSQLLIHENDLLFVTDKGLWLDTAFTANIDPKLQGNIEMIGKSTLTNYKLEVKKVVCLRHTGRVFEEVKEAKPMFTIGKSYIGEYPAGY